MGITRWWEPEWDPAGSLGAAPGPTRLTAWVLLATPSLSSTWLTVALDGVQADHQLAGDRLVGAAVGQQ